MTLKKPITPHGKSRGVGTSSTRLNETALRQRAEPSTESGMFVNDLEDEQKSSTPIEALDFDDMAPVARSFNDLPNLIPSPRVQKKRKVRKGTFLTGRSKFTFKLLKTKRKPSEPKPVHTSPVNKKLLEEAKRLKKPFLKDFEKNQGKISEFLVRTIAPLLLPAVSAIDDSKDMLREVMGVPVESPIYKVMMLMLKESAEIKLATFVTSYMKLTDQEKSVLFSRLEGHKNGAKEHVPGVQLIHKLLRSQESSNLLMQEILSTPKKAK